MALLAGLLWITLLRPPSALSLDNHCRPRGFVNSIRAELQGRTFWRSQAGILDKEMEYLLTLPMRVTEGRERMRKVSRNSRRLLDSLYGEYPQLRPSEATRSANALRAQADSIKAARIAEIANSYREKRIAVLIGCREQILSRTGE